MKHLGIAILVIITAGCGMKSLEDQTKKSDTIIGKTTQNIGEFKPEAGAKVSDSKIPITDPVSAGPASYGPILERLSTNEIAHAVNLFQASEGRYPMDYNEFMTKIIQENRIQLPQLPPGSSYQYDVENHKLVVIKGPAEAK